MNYKKNGIVFLLSLINFQANLVAAALPAKAAEEPATAPKKSIEETLAEKTLPELEGALERAKAAATKAQKEYNEEKDTAKKKGLFEPMYKSFLARNRFWYAVEKRKREDCNKELVQRLNLMGRQFASRTVNVMLTPEMHESKAKEYKNKYLKANTPDVLDKAIDDAQKKAAAQNTKITQLNEKEKKESLTEREKNEFVVNFRLHAEFEKAQYIVRPIVKTTFNSDHENFIFSSPSLAHNHS